MIGLGINYFANTHDSSACIARDGQILFAVAEERLSRVKHDARFPVQAIRACLDFAGVAPEELDVVCRSWPRHSAFAYHDLKCMLTRKLPVTSAGILTLARDSIAGTLQQRGRKLFERHFGATRAEFHLVDHHLAHALSAYAYSGFDDGAVLVIDGRGAHEATSLWHGRAGHLDHVWTIPFPQSLGLFYAQFTHYLGFTPFADEWKVMGLAPYGEPGVNLDSFISCEDFPYRIAVRELLGHSRSTLANITARFGPPRAAESEIRMRDKNVAYAVQDACERAMLALAREAVARTGSRNLCLAGGVALNSKANGKILASGLVDNLFVQPAASDDGACLGAVLAPYLTRYAALPRFKMRDAALGGEYSNAEIEKTLATYKLNAKRTDDVARSAACLLARGKIIGWFQGRMEFGPRALGHRSILADPRDPKMTERVNNAVKFREWWRPFAPSILAEAANEFLESATDSPFMVLTAQVRPEKRAVIPAVTHADGSARPQTVERDTNPLYWHLIHEFDKLTNVPVVMNTSFNLRGEPIVASPTDAVRTFFSSGLDALVIGDFVVVK